MKVFGLTFAILAAIIAVVAGLKSEICGQPHSRVGGDTISCTAYVPSWSYNSAENKCVEFIYGGCQGNDNRFETQEACETACKE